MFLINSVIEICINKAKFVINYISMLLQIYTLKIIHLIVTSLNNQCSFLSLNQCVNRCFIID